MPEEAPKPPKKSKSKTAVKSHKPKLVVRNALIADVNAIRDLSIKVYPDMPAYSKAMLQGHINNYAEGQFVAEFEGKIVGYCASIRVSQQKALSKHTWREITGGGFGSTHEEDGEYLYGMEIFVDPDIRGHRVGERFYNARKNLCRHERIKGIVFGGRLPLLAKRLKKVGTPEEYIEQVRVKKIKDPVLAFQLRRDFEVIGVLPGYFPNDKESLGYASHMVWKNIEVSDEPKGNVKKYGARSENSVRLATVQYQQRQIHSFGEFAQIVEYFVDVVADYKADFVVFPELFTLQLLSIENESISPEKAIDALTDYTERLKTLFSQLAMQYNVNIIGGSHPTKIAGTNDIQNICMVCLRDGSVYQQAKIHPTPNERYWWNIEGGDTLDVIQTDCGPIGVLICYDSEFPELARHLIDQGAMILFVPFCTDERQSYLRVRYSCQARAVENQCYVVMSGNVGNLPRVHNMDIQYAQSCILTPCDFPFARDGIAADATPNVEMVSFADLSIKSLHKARNSGTVQNLKDRRHDLYGLTWQQKK